MTDTLRKFRLQNKLCNMVHMSYLQFIGLQIRLKSRGILPSFLTQETAFIRKLHFTAGDTGPARRYYEIAPSCLVLCSALVPFKVFTLKSYPVNITYAYRKQRGMNQNKTRSLFWLFQPILKQLRH